MRVSSAGLIIIEQNEGGLQQSGMQGVELIERVGSFGGKTAVVDPRGSYSYDDLFRSSRFAALNLLGGRKNLSETRVAFLLPPGFGYVAVTLGTWMAGGVTVPLSPLHSPREIEHVLRDSGAATVVFHPDFSERLRGVSGSFGTVRVPDVLAGSRGRLPRVRETSRAMIIYTSGTTAEPKGVVSTHLNVKAQIGSMTAAWRWSGEDSILNVLPLHHLHGILNVLLCSLWSGARCEMAEGFSARATWERFMKKDLTLFMGVPTIYSRLADFWEGEDGGERRRMSASLRGLRLMVSGSAALPAPVFEKWRKISGHSLLERYGMTEIGMALSNPLDGERIAGSVGFAMPGVDVEIFGEDGTPAEAGEPGEIGVRGEGVFLEYWGKPEETRAAFRGGWFMTGDVAARDPDGSHRILGRRSVDIIKSGGYKVSALEVEAALSGHPAVGECAVVGIPDPDRGEKVCAAVVAKNGCSVEAAELGDWASRRLASYKLPRRTALVASLPRNSMGKVVKKDVGKFFENDL